MTDTTDTPPVALSIEEEGIPLLTARGDTPESAIAEALLLLATRARKDGDETSYSLLWSASRLVEAAAEGGDQDMLDALARKAENAIHGLPWWMRRDAPDEG